MEQQTKPTYSLTQLTKYFLKLGTIGFGGPVALVGYMHRDLVEKRKWITEEDYKEGLALAQLAPGPLAAQLSIYIGLCSLQDYWSNISRNCFCSSIFFNGISFGLCLCKSWRVTLDAGSFLWYWCGGDWYHCYQQL